jgi:hypothetical protein
LVVPSFLSSFHSFHGTSFFFEILTTHGFSLRMRILVHATFIQYGAGITNTDIETRLARRATHTIIDSCLLSNRVAKCRKGTATNTQKGKNAITPTIGVTNVIRRFLVGNTGTPTDQATST